MRIEAYNQVAQIYNTNKTSKAQNSINVSAGRDEVQISSFGRDYQIAKQAVAEAGDIREDKIKQLKASVNSDHYNVSMNQFADKLLENYNVGFM